MQIIPAIDLMNRQVVRGVGGRRAEYQPICSRLTDSSTPGDLAAALAEAFGFTTAYVADLDAIAGRPFDVSAYHAIAATGMRLWTDAGLGDPFRAESFLRTTEPLAAQIEPIIGLESLSCIDALSELLSLFGPQCPVISIDMKQGRLLTTIAAWRESKPLDVIQQVIRLGAQRLILLDLADVGAGQGSRTLEFCRQVKMLTPKTMVVTGGGVRSLADLEEHHAAGSDAALVASALHDGSLSPTDVRR